MTDEALPIRADVAERTRRLHAVVRGVVQGVGFRPFVYRCATQLELGGWVTNAPDGVVLEVEGSANRIANLLESLKHSPPVNAVITSIETQELGARGETSFVIRPSTDIGQRTVQILPDLATCPDCLMELFDETDRRYRYPFINCTQCGPRYSIIEDLPYDRERTSMRRFPMCPECQAEYEDPTSRRFHAEPNACPKCGPRLSLWDVSGRVLAHAQEALDAAAEALRRGSIVAVKGIGGFHLMADARDDVSINRLRERKRRSDKPFGVMFSALTEVAAACEVTAEAEVVLTSPGRPIVLLPKRGQVLSCAVAPGNPWIGALLPYTPLHHLLMDELGFPVVATSGNVTDESIVTDDHEALRRLAGIADLFLVHDRPIVRPVDDSVMRMVCGRELMLRRARGYAPAAIACGEASSGIIALGAHLKTTVALSHGSDVVLSQHIGDLETVEARSTYARAIADMTRLYEVHPRLAVRDLHPDYASSRAADGLGCPVLPVQHHLAHVAACMAEHEIRPPVLGVAWDGTGYGPDGTIWGGEFLLVKKDGWRRVAHLRPFRLPGGETAVREPRRAALGLLYEAFGARAFEMTQLPPVAAFAAPERQILGTMMARHINAPRTSSMGRLFDAFAALCGLRQIATYEGQAAIELEGLASAGVVGPAYELLLRDPADAGGACVIDWQPALEAAMRDLADGASPSLIANALHRGLANVIVFVAERIGERRVLLTGGCFQNAHLTETAVGALRAANFEPVWHRRIPPNDGGIAFGQAVWASRIEQGGQQQCA